MSLNRIGAFSKSIARSNLVTGKAGFSTAPKDSQKFNEKSAAVAFGIIGSAMALTCSDKPLRDAAICGSVGAGYGASIATLTRILTKRAYATPPFIIWAPMAIAASSFAGRIMDSLDEKNIDKEDPEPKMPRCYSTVTVNGKEVTDPVLKKEIEDGTLEIVKGTFRLIGGIFKLVAKALEIAIKEDEPKGPKKS